MDKKEQVTFIQVFLVGDSTAEIDGELKSMETFPLFMGFLVDPMGDGTEVQYTIPIAQIRMIRRWTEEA